MKKSALFTLLFLLGLSPHVYAQDFEKQLTGTPTIMAVCNAVGCAHRDLSVEEGRTAKVEIKHELGKYYWVTSQGIVLDKVQEGPITHFIEPQGRGYVRVVYHKGNCLFMEHVIDVVQTTTYWGSCTES